MKGIIIKIIICSIACCYSTMPAFSWQDKSESYELTPFNLIKKKPKKYKKSNNLEDYNVVGTENVEPPPADKYQFMIQSGYFFMIGYLKDRNDIYLPYTTLAFKRNYLELEAGYMAMRGSENILPKEDTSHSLPFFFNIAPELSINESFTITPKLGVGGIAIMTHSNYYDTRYSFLVAAKASLDLSYYVSKSVNIAIQNSFIVGQDIQEPFFTNMHFYYSPGLALNVQF